MTHQVRVKKFTGWRRSSRRALTALGERYGKPLPLMRCQYTRLWRAMDQRSFAR